METQWLGLHTSLRDKQQHEVIPLLGPRSPVSPGSYKVGESSERLEISCYPFLTLSQK